MWAYTNMADPCWTWGHRYVLLAQSEIVQAPQKSGVRSLDGWAAYAQPSGHLVVKRFHPDPRAAYPDFGCTVETYADTRMLELETLGPLTRLAPGAAVEHVEDWFLFQGVPPIHTESDVDAHVLPRALDTSA